jgi:hypothetical protein
LQLQELPEKLSLGWSIPAFDGGKPILNYTVKVNGETECEATSARICDFAEPRAGMTYEFEVFATNSIGDGAVATYSITMPAPPSTGVYVGPLVTHVMPNPAKPGALIVVSGAMLDIVETISIAGRELEFSIASSNALSVRLPANIAEGLYDIVITSSYGRLTVQDALLISLITTVIDSGDSGESGEDSGSSGTGNDSSSSSGSGEPGAGDSGSGTDSGTDNGSGSGSDSGSGSNGGSGSGSDNAGESEAPGAQDGEGSEGQGGAPDLMWLLYLLIVIVLILVVRRIALKK